MSRLDIEGSAAWRIQKREPFIKWVEANRILPEGAARPGRFKVQLQPAAIDLYNAFDDPEIDSIVIVATTQMMKSEFMLNAIFYTVAHQPSPILFIQPTENLAREFAKNRIEENAKAVPSVARWLAPKRSPDSGTLFARTFPQGSLNIVSSKQTDATISRALKLIFADEINKFDRDVTGQLKARLTTFKGGKMILASSVAPKGQCRIMPEFQHTDRRYWNCCCINCGSYFKPEWKHVIWKEGEENPASTARFVCPHCDYYMSEVERRESIRAGKYIAEGGFYGKAGFYVTAMANMFLTLADLVEEFIAARDKKDEDGDEMAMRDFQCDRLCINYEQTDGQPALADVKNLLIDYPMDGSFPAGIDLITMSCDVQADRLEVEACGWGWRDRKMPDGTIDRIRKSWGLFYKVIPGDTTEPPVWHSLRAFFENSIFPIRLFLKGEKYEEGDYVLFKKRAAMLVIDVGFAPPSGILADVIRRDARHRNQFIMPVKGVPGGDAALGRLGGYQWQIETYKKQMIYAGTVGCKRMIYAGIRKSSAAARRGDMERMSMVYPRGSRFGYDTDDNKYFLGLRAEREQIGYSRSGRREVKFVYESKAVRNEPLDLRVYNLAAFSVYNMMRDINLVRDSDIRMVHGLIDSGKLKVLNDKK